MIKENCCAFIENDIYKFDKKNRKIWQKELIFMMTLCTGYICIICCNINIGSLVIVARGINRNRCH